MALGPLIFLAVLALVYHPLMVSDRTDMATLNRLQDHEKWMKQEMELLQTEFDQRDWTWGPPETLKDWITAHQSTDDETCDRWHYVRLTVLFLFLCYIYNLGKEPSDNSSIDISSTTTSQDDDDDDDDTDTESEMFGNGQQVLQAFYDRHIDVDTSDLNNMCSFIESFVNDLLEACRNAFPYQNTLPLLENCIGVDSAFEGWHSQASKPFSVLVPVLPPKGHSFHLETMDSEGTPSKHGHILVEMECVCKRERLLGDVMCFLHHPEQKLSEDKQGAFLLHVLCTSSHLDVDKTIHWFQSLVGEAWKNIRYKYNLDLLPQPSNTSCKLKLAFKSGRTITVDIILGVQQGDSLVFLATQGAEMDHLAGTVWQKTFAIQELLFFKWVSQRVPEESCHLKCLQLLIYLKESNQSDRKNPVLTNYHYKNCLMHLLLFQPLSDWRSEDTVQWLYEMLLFMYTALKEKCLHHFLIGNISLPVQIPMPKALRSAPPLNLFKHLAQDPNLHAEAVREFEEIIQQVRPLVTECEE
ncbi:inositol 1,4,5-trisphosphate receptor-interacting protein-like 1 [Eublepharis macularius]|uniref:Inositol 1,4,5-trisphosphate receptor-interacting protein-like 1 n=1 Tax=Eublepharis macularius TaxID=481883 RepID=A0AA97LF94_EUBMA|nr:inositol 1,4,5-trisphosphate receptor-interacting protein-like 1 [Eublepharis macularius]